MKFFVDTASHEEIREAAALGVLDGVTIDPARLIQGGKEPAGVLREIVSLVNGPVCVEVGGEVGGGDPEAMLARGRELAAMHPHVVVQLPLTGHGLRACKALRSEGAEVGMIGCSAAGQALLAAKAEATLVRIDDGGPALVRRVREIYDNYGFETQILVGSIRQPDEIVEAAEAGAEGAVARFSVLAQLAGDASLVTDWKKG